MKVYFNDDERCEKCGSDNVITLHDSKGALMTIAIVRHIDNLQKIIY